MRRWDCRMSRKQAVFETTCLQVCTDWKNLAEAIYTLPVLDRILVTDEIGYGIVPM